MRDVIVLVKAFHAMELHHVRCHITAVPDIPGILDHRNVAGIAALPKLET